MRALLDVNFLIAFRDAQVFSPRHVHRSAEITDLYLLALAVKRGGRLVTFDQSISLLAVHGAGPDQLCLIV